MMGVAEAIGLDPVSVLVQTLVEKLHERAQGLAWRSTAEGLVADIAEGELLLSPIPGPTALWRLTAVFSATGSASGELGRRCVGWGALGHMEQRALDLGMYGVPGGPSVDQATMAWQRARDDGSARMTVPGGALRIAPVGGKLCSLTYEDEHGVELLSLGTAAELERQAFPMCLTRATRPLQVRIHDRCVNLRSVGVPGVLGYHALEDRSLVALALIGDDFLLLHVRGLSHRVVARLSWADVMFGEPVEMRPLSPVRPVAAPDIPRTDPHGDVATSEAAPLDQVPSPPQPPPGEPCTTHPPMADWHRELCRRYFKRLLGRLTGRGARKARQLVLLILETLAVLRENITGSRLEVHARLLELLDRRTPGGPRNIRDCIDLLIRTTPVARAEAGKRCTLRFAELHDPESELMRLIADEDELEEPAANTRPSTIHSESGLDDPASAVPAAVTPAVAPIDEVIRVAPGPAPQPAIHVLSSAATSEVAPEQEPADPALVQVFRCFARQPDQAPAPEADVPVEHDEQAKPATAPSPTARPLPPGFGLGRPASPQQSLNGFIRRGTYFLGEFVSDDNGNSDDNDPSRFRGLTESEQPNGPPGAVRPKADGRT